MRPQRQRCLNTPTESHRAKSIDPRTELQKYDKMFIWLQNIENWKLQAGSGKLIYLLEIEILVFIKLTFKSHCRDWKQPFATDAFCKTIRSITFMLRGLTDRHYTEFTLVTLWCSKSAFKDSDVTTHNPELFPMAIFQC